MYETVPVLARNSIALSSPSTYWPRLGVLLSAKIVVAAELEGKRLVAHVDLSLSNAWKAEPYYGQLKRWARLAVPKRNQVVVCIGRRAIVILPNKDVDLGVIDNDEAIVTRETPIAMKIKRDDPREPSFHPLRAYQ
jgi:hypothetical protein